MLFLCGVKMMEVHSARWKYTISTLLDAIDTFATQMRDCLCFIFDSFISCRREYAFLIFLEILLLPDSFLILVCVIAIEFNSVFLL